MIHGIKLPDIHHIVLILQHGSLVPVHIQIVGSREYCNESREPSGLTLTIHLVPTQKMAVNDIHDKKLNQFTHMHAPIQQSVTIICV